MTKQLLCICVKLIAYILVAKYLVVLNFNHFMYCYEIYKRDKKLNKANSDHLLKGRLQDFYIPRINHYEPIYHDYYWEPTQRKAIVNDVEASYENIPSHETTVECKTADVSLAYMQHIYESDTHVINGVEIVHNLGTTDVYVEVIDVYSQIKTLPTHLSKMKNFIKLFLPYNSQFIVRVYI